MDAQVESTSRMGDVQGFIPAFTDEAEWARLHPFQVPLIQAQAAAHQKQVDAAEQQPGTDFSISVYPALVAGQQASNYTDSLDGLHGVNQPTKSEHTPTGRSEEEAQLDSAPRITPRGSDGFAEHQPLDHPAKHEAGADKIADADVISFSPRTKALNVHGHVTLPQADDGKAQCQTADRGSGQSDEDNRASGQSDGSAAAAQQQARSSPDVSPRRGTRLVHSISTLPSPFARATTHVVRQAQHMQQLEDEALLLSNAAAAAVAAFPLPGDASLCSDRPTEDMTASTSTYMAGSGSLRGTTGSQRVNMALPTVPVCGACEITQPPGAVPLSPRSAQELWHGAVRNINKLHLVSRQFRTLRDMRTPSEIPREAIKVVSMLGKGAFAIVEQCVYQPAGGRPQLVAVKRLRPELTKNKEDLRDLVQEVALLRKLHHRNVIEFLGYGYWEFSTSATTRQGSLFIVEELVDGGNMKTLVSQQLRDTRCRHYRAADAIRWLKQVANGLGYLHASHPQVIHRDLKLENVLLKGRDVTCSEAKLGDFGLSAIVRRTSVFSSMQKHLHKNPVRPARARRNSATDMEAVWADAAARRNSTIHGQAGATAAAAAAADAKGHSGSKRTAGTSESSGKKPKPKTPGLHIGLSVATGYEQLSGRTGTLMYMAPEVYRQEPYSEKADVFSWSIIAYELLHRYMMIRATDGSLEECQAYARRVAYGFRPPINHRMPRELVSLLTRCWDHNPDKRPDMASVAQRLAVLEKTLDLEAFDRDLLGAAYTLQLAQDLRPHMSSTFCCCVIS